MKKMHLHIQGKCAKNNNNKKDREKWQNYPGKKDELPTKKLQ